MTFYVEKRLPLGAISFGVTPNRTGAAADESGLSTGASGEFVRRHNEGYFFGGDDPFRGPALPEPPSVVSVPFWTYFKSDKPSRAYGFIALMAFGFLFMLLGFAVIGRKGSQGWFEVILGLAMIAAPIVLTARKRRKIREQEERQRAEREAIDKKNRELLASYTAVLEQARKERSQKAFARLAQKREALTVPYEIWAPVARRTVLLIGFDELARRGPIATADITRLMDRAASAAGLSAEDQNAVKRDLVRTIVWHLVADDRLGKLNGLPVNDDDARAVEQLRRLQGLNAQTLPRAKCSSRLDFHEYCIYETATDHGTLHVTNKRVIVDGKRRIEMPVAHAFDVIANADESVVVLKTADPKKPLRLRVDEPIYAAGILDVASTIDERPRGFA